MKFTWGDVALLEKSSIYQELFQVLEKRKFDFGVSIHGHQDTKDTCGFRESVDLEWLCEGH